MDEAELDELARDFERDGFVNAGLALSESETAALLADLERYMDGLFRGGPQVISPGYAADLGHTKDGSHYQISSLWKVSDPFRRLIENKRMGEVAARLTRSRTLQLWVDTIQYKPPLRGGPFNWHQDAPYHQSIEPADRLLGAWVALDDADEESGCMWMVPGSHRWGFQEPHLWTFHHNTDPQSFGKVTPPQAPPVDAGEWRGAVPCIVRAGDVHFHHAYMWHGSPTNHTNRPRRGYSMFLMPEDVRVSHHPDMRIPLPAGSLMLEAGPEFPIVYRAPEAVGGT